MDMNRLIPLALLFLAAIAQAQPTNDSLNPGSGSALPGATQTFTATYGDANGYQDVVETDLIVNNSPTFGGGSCYLWYSAYTNAFYLVNDAGNGWSGPAAAGSGTVLQNSQCTLYASGS